MSPISGYQVSIKKDGAAIASAFTNSEGLATFYLEEGTYEVHVVTPSGTTFSYAECVDVNNANNHISSTPITGVDISSTMDANVNIYFQS